jgi:hypothetical protein
MFLSNYLWLCRRARVQNMQEEARKEELQVGNSIGKRKELMRAHRASQKA